MARKPTDDLFADSVMSFGEHIEELRMALARALVGLVIGIAIGFVFADNVVRLIESPLKDALRAYHADRALDTFAAELEPEQLTLIERTGVAPEHVQLEVQQLVQRLGHRFAGVLDPRTMQMMSVAYFDPQQMQHVPVAHVSQSLLEGKESPEEPEGVLWSLMTSTQRETVKRLAETEVANDQDRETLRTLLNELVDHPKLHQAAPFQEIETFFRGETLKASLATFQDRVEAEPTPELRARLNRWILTAAMYPDLPRPRSDVIELPVWKTVDAQIITLNAQEAFMVWFKAAFVTGFLIASPWIFWQLWMFVAAGLYPHEKGYVYTFLPFSMTLFAAGAALAFFAVFPFVLDFLFYYNRQLDIVPNLRLSEWMSLALMLPLGFGISFQLPLVMLLLERIGIFTIESYVSKWRISVLVICVISMVLTPADPTSMLMMAVPLVFLYFGGIALCKWMPRRESPFGDALDPV